MSRQTRTLRGQITAVGGKADKQLILNDQLINMGFRVTGFFVWPIRIFGATPGTDLNAILSFAQIPSTDQMNANDNRQIGWTWFSQSGGTLLPQPTADGFSTYQRLLDPDHIINRDLFLSLRLSTDQTYNYMVVLERRTLTDEEAIVTIIKENSQSLEL